MEFRGGVGSPAPGALSPMEEGRPGRVLKVHNVPASRVGLAGGRRKVAALTSDLSGKHEVIRSPRVVIVLPRDKGPGTFKAGKIHGVNSIHAFNHHLDGSDTNW